MGKSLTSKYRVELRVMRLRDHMRYTITSTWRGAASMAALEKYARDFEASTMAGGANAHLEVHVFSSAFLVRQSDGVTVAEYTKPMFQAM